MNPFCVCEAEFKGKNGSHKYETGKRYRIVIEFSLQQETIFVQCAGHLPCRYSNRKKLLENWGIRTGEVSGSE